MDIGVSFEAVASLDPSVDAEAYRRDFVGPERFDSLASFLASTGNSSAIEPKTTVPWATPTRMLAR